MPPFERETRFDDLARFVSEGVPRRVALRRIGGFVAALALSGPAEALGATRKKKCPKGHALCGTRCCPTNFSCHTHKGKKTCVCASPHKLCSGTCINPKTDPKHCGSCGKKCKTGETCVSGKCKAKAPATHVTCTDGLKNGLETDVDCGGPTCPKCATGKRCLVPADCQTGVCTSGVCAPAAAQCSDAVCGAAVGCPPCANGRGCGSAADCASGRCVGSVCVQCAGAPDCPAAAVGSCQRAVCSGGTCGFAADDSNLPPDDGNPCTTDTCNGGVPTHPATAGNPACPGGHCDQTGTCVPDTCQTAADCGVSTECVTRTCTHGQCNVTFAAAGTALTTGQTAGDCKKLVCDGSGGQHAVPDTADIPTSNPPCLANGRCVVISGVGTPEFDKPDHTTTCPGGVCDGAGNCTGCVVQGDCPQAAVGSCQVATCIASVCGFTADNANLPSGNGCTTPTCTAGVPSNPPKAADAPCGTGMFCDGTGTCVGCVLASECPQPASGSCQAATCVANTCGFAADNSNLPPDDNPCTTPTCTAGVPSNPPKATGTGCGGGSVCDGAGTCVGCVMPSDCAGTDTACQQRTCTGGMCGTAFAAGGTTCPTGACDGAGTCVGFTQGTPCASDQVCASGHCVDAFCCSSACTATCSGCSAARTGGANGTCAHLNQGTPCTGGVCSTGGTCVQCNTGTDCPSAANATPICISNVCGLTCHSGFGDCDGLYNTGCEANLTNDHNNCGTCGNPCAVGHTCASSVCT